MSTANRRRSIKPCLDPGDSNVGLLHGENVGNLNEAMMRPREISRTANLAGADTFVLLLNHPSGDPTASDADHRSTRRIYERSEIVDIQMFDHTVIRTAEEGRPPFYGFR